MPMTKTAPKRAPKTDKGGASKDGSSRVEKTTELSDQVLEQLQTGQRSAIAAVRKFIDSADNALPSLGDGPSRPQEVIDSALELSERLLQVQYDFVRSVVQSTGAALSGPDGKK
jgi:hypothetical protein